MGITGDIFRAASHRSLTVRAWQSEMRLYREGIWCQFLRQKKKKSTLAVFLLLPVGKRGVLEGSGAAGTVVRHGVKDSGSGQ